MTVTSFMRYGESSEVKHKNDYCNQSRVGLSKIMNLRRGNLRLNHWAAAAAAATVAVLQHSGSISVRQSENYL
jgi:hypothetical protein